jgi:3-dehydroquinate dehydratase/shikimate dehydrogenase
MQPGGLCVTLTPSTVDEIFAADISRAESVEIRLDYLKDLGQAAHSRWDRLPLPVIATCRGKERGGEFSGSPEEEIAILENAARNGAQYVDIDYRFAKPIAGAKVIASYHDFAGTPHDVDAIAEQVFRTEASIAKIATRVNTWSDNRRLFDLLSRKWPKPAIVLGMGDMGQITRVAGPSRGSFLTFAASDRAAAPGQMSIAEMLDVYKFRRIRPSTKLLGILGMPVGHSMSPVIHNRAFEAANLDLAFVKLPAPDIRDFMENARGVGIHGFSVTIPHKIAVIPYLAGLQPAANEVGAVNTVSNANGFWIGDNTDVHGVRAAMASAGFDPAGKKIVILGKGGGAKAAAVACKGASEVTMLSRQTIGTGAQFPCDLLINATPIGMYPNVDAAPVEGPISADVVFDMVYNPDTTRLLDAASRQGKTVIRGKQMLLAQAARQFEIWTGQPAPPGVYEMNLSS